MRWQFECWQCGEKASHSDANGPPTWYSADYCSTDCRDAEEVKEAIDRADIRVTGIVHTNEDGTYRTEPIGDT